MSSKFSILLASLILLVFCVFRTKAQNLSQLSFKKLDSLVLASYLKGDFGAALPYLEEGKGRALKLFGKQDSTYANYLADHAFFHYKAGLEYGKAEQNFKEALSIRAHLFGEEHPQYINNMLNIGSFYYTWGRINIAIKYLSKSLELQAKTNGEQTFEYAINLNSLAICYAQTGAFYKELPLLKKALKIIHKVKGKLHPRYISINTNMGHSYRAFGDYNQAERCLMESRNLCLEAGNGEHPDYGLILNELALLYQQTGAYNKAEVLYLQAKDIFSEKLGTKHPLYSIVLNNLAVLYGKINENEKLETLQLESMHINLAVKGKNFEYARSLNNLGMFYLQSKRYNKAVEYLEKGLYYYEQNFGQQHLGYLHCLENLAHVYSLRKEYSKASKLFDQILEQSTDLQEQNSPHFLKTLNNYAVFQIEINALEEALNAILLAIKLNNFDAKELQLDALDAWKEIEFIDPVIGIHSFQTLIHILLKKKSHNASILPLIHLTLSKSMQLRRSLLNNNDKLHHLTADTELIETGIEFLLKKGGQQNIQEAFYLAGLNKSVLLSESIKDNRALNFGDLPDSLKNQEISLFEQLATLSNQLDTSHNDNSAATYKKALGELQINISEFLHKLKDKYPKYHAIKYQNTTATATEIQAILQPNSMLIEFFVCDSNTYLFALRSDSIQLLNLPISKSYLKQKVKQLRTALSNYNFILHNQKEAYRMYTEQAWWFYKNLMAPVLTDTLTDNLVIVTDDELGHLPFEIFLTEQANQKPDYKNLEYLIKDYEVRYSYSSTLLKENMAIQSKINNNKVLAYAPSYIYKHQLADSMRSPHWLEIRKSLAPLHQISTEIKQLSNVYKGVFITDSNAVEEHFKEHAASYSIIHLAMHGILDLKNPLSSALAFYENNDVSEDNFLQAWEISSMNLNAEMVVLSACETGYGKFEKGEGVLSLARSFMYAGVPSMVVSLWQVNDVSTAKLMQHFYSNLAAGMTKSAALRQAKLSFIEHSKGLVAHPAFWSAFVQIGDNKPLNTNTKSNKIRFIVAFVLGLLSIFTYIYTRKNSRN